jgi:hypothetical protein
VLERGLERGRGEYCAVCHKIEVGVGGVVLRKGETEDGVWGGEKEEWWEGEGELCEGEGVTEE